MYNMLFLVIVNGVIVKVYLCGWLLNILFKSSPSKSILPAPPSIPCKLNRRKKLQRKFHTLFFLFCLFVFCFFEYAHMHVISGGVFLAKPHGWENLVIYPSEKICYDVSVRPNADRTDSGGGGSQESARLGRSMKWLRWNVCISSTPLVSAVNHMATRTFKEKKNKSFFPLNFNVHINLDNTKRARARNE